MKSRYSLKKVLPVLFGFWIMGFVDVIGISVSYAKEQFGWSEIRAGFLPFMVFFWFLVLSVPVASLMNRFGRKNVVLLSMLFTFVGMVLPYFLFNEWTCYHAFALLGIGNTILQVSLNPLLQNVVSGKMLTSSLTVGQLVKALSAFVGPLLAGYCSYYWGGWEMMFLIYAVITLLSTVWLYFVPISREETIDGGSSIGATFGLLKDCRILVLFLGIICVVGLDVGMNTVIPKLLIERIGVGIEEAGYSTSAYFAARTLGAFLGVFILAKVSEKLYFTSNMLIALLALVGLILADSYIGILIFVCIIAFCAAGIFSVIYSLAMKTMPHKSNEISGLMITGVSGGAMVPLLMGVATDVCGTQIGSLLVLGVCIVYLLFCSFTVKILRNVNE